jgi:hypothetical protein
MNKEEHAAFLRWISTASDAQLESALVRMEALREVLREEGPRADSSTMASWIRAELEARRSVR